MNSPRALFVLGILVLLSPYFGLPYEWLRFVLPILGVFIVIAAFRVRSVRSRRTEFSHAEQTNV